MSDEVFEMIQRMDLQNVELQMALQCAPLLSRLKLSNLLIISKSDVRKVKQILKYSDISCYILSVVGQKATLLLYREELLKRHLREKENHILLYKMGYEKITLSAILKRFGRRYLAYQEKKASFPHEMGVLLGYPSEDVIGFIENQGKNFLFAGYWKVYAHEREKLTLFATFEKAKDYLIQFISGGGRLEEIWEGSLEEELSRQAAVYEMVF